MRLTVLTLIACVGMHAQAIHVDASADPGGDGSGRWPFNTLSAAVAYANTLDKPPVIQLSPGRYEINDTLRIERGMTINGSSQLEFDADGLPTGQVVDPATETRIVSSPTFTAKRMIDVGKSGEVIRDVKLRNLILQSGPTNPDVLVFSRVQDYEVHDCIFMATGTVIGGAGIDTWGSSGTIHHSYTTRLLGAAFIGAGYPGSPANVVFRQNRAVLNRVGLFLQGTSDGIPEPGDQLNVEIRDNDLSNNFEVRGSAGIRIVIKGPEDRGNAATGLSTGHVQALIRNNRLVGNKIGIVVDGGFVLRRAPAPPSNVCDTRTYSGSMDITLRDNTLADSTFLPTLITFTQFQATLTILEGLPANYTTSQFLHLTEFRIADPDGILAGAYVSHPETDPFVGPPCPNDVTHELLQNTLRVNGSVIPNTAQ